MSITFKKIFPTPTEHTDWTNKCQLIIVHHTWTKEWTIDWVLDWLYRRADYASCHFCIDTNWDIYKIWKPEDILWHAWVSEWWEYTKSKDWVSSVNNCAIWIEVIWPLSNWWFTYEQQVAVKTLVRYLMQVYWISKERVLRHADITWAWSKNKQLRDEKSPARKVDIAWTFFKPKYKNWLDYQNSL